MKILLVAVGSGLGGVLRYLVPFWIGAPRADVLNNQKWTRVMQAGVAICACAVSLAAIAGTELKDLSRWLEAIVELDLRAADIWTPSNLALDRHSRPAEGGTR